MEHLHKAETNTTGVHEERCWERLVSSCFLLNGGSVSSGWTDKHSLTMSGPQMVPSAAGMNLVSHRCPVLWHHNDLQMSWWARTHREHSQKRAYTRWEPFNLPGLHLTTPTTCFYSIGLTTFPTNKKACQNQSLCYPKETCYYRCILFLPTIRQ